MTFSFKLFIVVVTVTTCVSALNTTRYHASCGCTTLRSCYSDMLDDLQEQDESACLSNTEISTSTMMVYFKAVQDYCGNLFNVTTDHFSTETRYLYEVVLYSPKDATVDINRIPLILIDAGQRATLESVTLAMKFIERLMACEENEFMIQNARWVFLPCVNPDGLEHVRFDRPAWRKNTKRAEDGLSYGTDISNNFESHWNECETGKKLNSFSSYYPGPAPTSEPETRFVTDVIMKYKDLIKAYVSIRGNGHAILYPHGFSDKSDDVSERVVKIAGAISSKVNQRGGIFQTFVNTSIFLHRGQPVCGSSIDFAHGKGIGLSLEMLVGFGRDIAMIKTFKDMPVGYQETLTSAYFSGLKELFNILRKEVKN